VTHVSKRNARWALSTAVLSAITALCVVVATGAALAATSNLSVNVDSTYQTNGRVEAILTIGNDVYVGGQFTSVRPPGAPAGTGEVPRQHLAAFDRTTGALLTWNPGTDKEVLALTASLDGTAVYVGGSFTKVGSVSRARLAKLDASTGAVLAWAPSTDQQVNTIAVTSTLIYLGGTFDQVNGVARSRLAAVDAAGALNSAWQPQADNRVRIIQAAPDGQSLFVGGDFLSIGGDTSQKAMVRLSTVNGAPLAWQFHPGYPVHGIVFLGSTLYAAGDGSGGHIGAFDLSTGARLWTLQTDGGVQAITIINGVIYGGGHFDNVCLGVVNGPTTGFKCPTNQATRHKLLAIDPTTGAVDPWDPGANSPLGVFALANAGGSLQAGGDFTKLGSPDLSGQATMAQQGYGQFSPA
jgi:outer membrane protein assembly factor BamB